MVYINPKYYKCGKPRNITLTLIIFLVTVYLLENVYCFEEREISLRMADIRPDHSEQYICIANRLPMGNVGEYIVKFSPNGSSKKVHHMILYGCEWPGYFLRDSPDSTWDCGEMSKNNIDLESSFVKAPICQGKTQIIYAWAKDAPILELPENVGFKIGGIDTGIHFLVLQVHYAHDLVFRHNKTLTDNSGIDVQTRLDDGESLIDKRAGVFVMISAGIVAKGVSEHKIMCSINENLNIHPFKFRVHTHSLGTLVEGYKVAYNQNTGKQHRYLIGQGNPQDPQMFYPVEDKSMILSKGDIVHASCNFNNNRSHEVMIGQTGDDEMCNFYVMYWTEGRELLKEDTCISQNPNLSLMFNMALNNLLNE